MLSNQMILTLIVISFFAGVGFAAWRFARRNVAIPGGKPLPGPKGEPTRRCKRPSAHLW